jgi:hypothetical protein
MPVSRLRFWYDGHLELSRAEAKAFGVTEEE